jgi:hypothetical protein
MSDIGSDNRRGIEINSTSDIPIPAEESTVSIPYGPPEELKKIIATSGNRRIVRGKKTLCLLMRGPYPQIGLRPNS